MHSEVCEVLGKRRISAYDVLERIAVGLSIPRAFLGLAFGEPAEVGPSVVEYPPMPPAPPAPPPPPVVRFVEVCARCCAVPTVTTWTGAEIRLLREALRLSVRDFANRLGVTDRQASKWEQRGSSLRPRQATAALMDTMLRRADPDARRRFGATLQTLRAVTAAQSDSG